MFVACLLARGGHDCLEKTAGGAPCRLRSEAWLAGSPVHARCPALAMYMQQRWEVEPGLDCGWVKRGG